MSAAVSPPPGAAPATPPAPVGLLHVDTRNAGVRTLIVGCGNVLRGDDAAGPVLVRRLWARGLPDGVRCADGGTGGMDVAFQMRGVPDVVVVDACRTGAEPGTLYAVPGAEVEQLPPLGGINLHAFRWDHALAFARWLLRDDYPAQVRVYLIEAASLAPGAPLTPAVDRAVERLCDHLLATLAPVGPLASATPGASDARTEHPGGAGVR